MAKQKDEKTNVMRVLEQKKVAYTAHTYPHEEGVAVDGVTVARSMGQDPECVFKTLVARGASGGYYVFDIPVGDSLDLKKEDRLSGGAGPCRPHRLSRGKDSGPHRVNQTG